MKKLFLFLIVFISGYGFSQKLNITMTPTPEYILDNQYVDPSINFYLPQGDKYQLNKIKFENNGERDYSFKTIIKDKVNPAHDSAVLFTDIRKVEFKQILSELHDIKFTYKEFGKTYTVVFSDGYAVNKGGYFDLVPVTINNSQTIVLLFKVRDESRPKEITGAAGYIVPLKDKLRLKLYESDNYKVEYKQEAATEKDRESVRENIYSSYPKGNVIISKGKAGVQTLNTAKTIIIPPVYDSIHIKNTRFIRAYKNGIVSLFSNDGTLISLSGIRAEYVNSNGILSILKDNDVNWINKDGAITTEYPGFTGGCGTVPRVTDTIIIQKGYYINRNIYQYGGDPVIKDSKVIKASNYKKLEFLNSSTVTTQYMMGSSEYYMPADCFIATAFDNTKSIVQINYKDDTPTAKTLFLLGNSKILSKELGSPLRYEKNGLKGFWPQNKTATYKTLGNFEKGFVRFIKADGRKGWLCLDGNEYFDL